MNKSSSSNLSKGPLKVNRSNKRYFTDDGRRAIYLSGSHTWANFQDISTNESRVLFNYEAYLAFMQEYHHNFMRMWIWEQPAWAPWTEKMLAFDPVPYARTGDG